MPRPRLVTDDQIISGTIAAIGKHGPAKLTLAHVATEVGVTPAALVRRFGSKAALLAAVANAGADYADEVFDSADARTPNAPLEALRHAISGLAGPIHDRIELANHMAMLQLDISDPDLRRQTAAQSRAIRRRIGLLLERAVSTGELRATDTGALADAVHTAYSGGLITWAIEGRGSLSAWLRGKADAVLQPYRT